MDVEGEPRRRSARPSPLTSPAPATASPIPRPTMRKPPVPSDPRSTLPGVARPKTTYARPVPEAPISRSGRPSPFTSPAGATALPARSPGAPSIRNPLPASEPTSTASVSALPYTTNTAPFGPAKGAPNMTSARPSPLTSPAPATENSVPRFAPSIRKPCPPRSWSEMSWMAAPPKITVALFGTTWPCLNSARPSLTTRSAFPSPFTSPGAAATVPRLGAFGSAWILNPRPPIDPRSTSVGPA